MHIIFCLIGFVITNMATINYNVFVNYKHDSYGIIDQK